ncbi:SDR family NAD(P)-dependent oxidoreductase [Pontibacter ramchanderi]|uniref:NAD(P)-dependent dehydrogenase (Short-subunit alcohol dehydrogenase family) n=1 Tax=Pontibacter ramchanderi TaxID=1179743 RepID=A0A2N3U7H5_9BACT|nr:SDR family oxidoreductase [Pontibacter ramchanderi]PKV62710.1 NAD(P)-dependent dehydrogenase (short-subunit alcohol dehydrogenase family) [Pontibacter ramchanderi]
MSRSITDLFSLSGKVALVTGGYGHLGTAISLGLAEAGATVYVLGRSEEKFREAFGEHSDLKITFAYCDISDTATVAAAFRQVQQEAGRIDVLVNNAFYSKGQQPEQLTDEEWAYGIDGNLNSVYRCIREVIPYLKQNGGRIINVSSMYGMVSPDFSIYDESPAFLNPPHYGAAKAGVLQLTRYFACYLGKHNITVNAVTPGPFPSEQVQQNEVFVEQLKRKNPLGRIGQPDDLKGAFVYLASDASSFMTGQNMVLDGGWTAW